MPHNTCAQSFEPTVNVTGSTPALEAKSQEKSNTGEWTPYNHVKDISSNTAFKCAVFH